MQRAKWSKRGNVRLLAAVGAVGTILLSGHAFGALTWDSSGTNPTSPTDGAGTWNTSTLQWSNGTSDLYWTNGSTSAVFGDSHGAAGAVNLSVPITVGGLVFDPAGSGNYNLTGSSLTLSSGTVQLSGADPTINANLLGSSGLILSGSGSLTLAGSDSYSGTTNVSGATLISASASAIPSGNLIVSASGAMAFNASSSQQNVLNNGTLSIAAGQTLNLSTGSYSFQQSGGTLNINGTLNVNGTTFNYSGGTINGTVTMNGYNPTLYLGAAVSTGTFLIDNSGSYAELETPTIPAGVTVLFQPTEAGTPNFETPPLTNNGTLKLISANGSSISFFSTLTNNGSFTVGATGTPSGPMQFDTFINNAAGVASFNTSATLENVLNNGTFTISAGQTVGLGTGSYSFQQSGGALNINGTLNVNGGTFNYSGGTINGTVTMNGYNPTLYLGAAVSTGTFLIDNSGSYAELETPTIPAGVTVLFQPTEAGTPNFETPPLTNNGTLKLISANGSSISFFSTLTNNGSFTVGATGTPSGPMQFDTFINNAAGVASFNTSATLENVLNNGTFTISAGQTVGLGTGSYSFQQSGGTLNINGTLNVNGGTFNYSGGTINGTVTMNGYNPTLYLGTAVSTGTFLIDNSGSYAELETPTIPAGVTVLFQPTEAGTPNFETPPLTNNGTLKLISANGSSISFFSTLTNNGSFTVGATGTPSGPMQFDTFINNAAGVASFNTSATLENVLNNGTFTISAGQTVGLGTGSYSFQQSGGALNINGTLNVNGTTFNYSGGTVNGTVTMNGSNPTLYLGAAVSTGTFLIDNSGSYAELETPTIPAGVTVLFQPTEAGTPNFETPPLTNNGTLKLISANGSSISFFSTLTNNGSFTVGATGTPSGPMQFDTFINNAAATANFNTAAKFSGNLTNFGGLNLNVGTMQLSSGYVFTQSGGTTTVAAASSISLPAVGQFVINGGTINLAASATSPGSLNIVSLLWPNPSIAMNPATDVASIYTTFVLAGQLPGVISLYGDACTFNIADPNATLTITAAINNGSLTKTGPGTLVLNGTEGLSGTLAVSGGTVTIGSNASFTNNIPITVASGATLNVMGSIPNDAINNNGTVNFPAQSTGGVHLVDIAGLTLAAGQISTVANPTLHANRTLLEIGSLSFGGASDAWQGLLDVTGNDLDLPGASLSIVTNQVKQGYSGGTWLGTGGITSSAAAMDTAHLTALGVIQNNQNGTAIYGNGSNQPLFDGIAPGPSDVLVKYTFYGDSNLDGQVDGSDYSRIDSAYLTDKSTPGKYTGWFNGDFNYDGTINGSDYTLIDNAYNTQGASLAALVGAADAVATAQVYGTASVPEPTAIGLLGLSAMSLLGRRNRHFQ